MNPPAAEPNWLFFDAENRAEVPPLPDGEVHVYRRGLTAAVELPWHDLIDRERERAEQYRLEKPRRQYVLTRSTLRRLLGLYLGAEPAAVAIDYEPSGKPILRFAGGAPLQFNVSHSEGFAILAFSKRGRVGVDIETVKPMGDLMGLVSRFFTARETAILGGLDEDERLRAFYRAWTRKEAILKAVGRGVQSLDVCEVTLLAGDAPRLVMLDDDFAAHERWAMTSWLPAGVDANYIAAAAWERH